MKSCLPTLTALVTATVLSNAPAMAQEATRPVTPAEKEAYYQDVLEKRVAAILKELVLTNATESSQVHDLLTKYYRALKDRDESLAASRESLGKEVIGTDKGPAVQARDQTRMRHEQFIAKLSAELTPAQIETIKDLMTYKKVKFTYDGYNAIVPGLTDEEKGKILEMLKAAREEAIDGGSTAEKSAIFQRYKDKINEYLTQRGHDIAQAYKDWNAKQELAKKQKESSAPPAQQPAR